MSLEAAAEPAPAPFRYGDTDMTAAPPERPPAPAEAMGEPVDEAIAWAAVMARDAAQDGRFVFAVTTTGIYCRPSCPARRPRRANARFFPRPEVAEAAGFRPCRRCRPHQGAVDPGLARALAARAYLEDHLEETVTLARLATAVGGSPYHLQRTFKRCFGVSPRQWVNARRLQRVRDRLRDRETVTAALYEAGFVDGRQLYGQSDARLGMTPGRWRRGGAGVRVRWATAASPLGRLLVAGTDRGICAVMLGDDDDELEGALRRNLPRADLEAAGDELTPWITEVVRRAAGAPASAQLPLDLQATAFQERVWQELTRIPRGATRTYGEVASALGRPRASRAVGRACAANPVALLIPCHRVVSAGGEPGGYRWGRDRKRALLAREAQSTPEPES